MWFQHSGPPTSSENAVRNGLDAALLDHWIIGGGGGGVRRLATAILLHLG